jgi:hypothetical protein
LLQDPKPQETDTKVQCTAPNAMQNPKTDIQGSK